MLPANIKHTDANRCQGFAMAGGGMVSREVFRPSFTPATFGGPDTSGKAAPGNVQNITRNFNSAKDGSFSKQSAEQAGRAAVHAMNRFSNKSRHLATAGDYSVPGFF